MKASTLRDWQYTGTADVDMLRDGRDVRCPECGAWIRVQFDERPDKDHAFHGLGRCQRCGRAEVSAYLVMFLKRVCGPRIAMPEHVAPDDTGQIRLFG